jgi:hypothetical protein
MEQKLRLVIMQKEDELDHLKDQYNQEIEKERNEKLKVMGFDRVLYLLGFEFESSSQRTPQYLQFHRVFRTEFKRLLKPHTSEIQISSPNHFDVTGFFKTNRGQIFYFSVGDLRWDKDSMLIRVAKDFKDYSGGSNGFIKIDRELPEKLIKHIKSNHW